jgi:hypothetical protein
MSATHLKKRFIRDALESCESAYTLLTRINKRSEGELEYSTVINAARQAQQSASELFRLAGMLEAEREKD